MHPIKKKCHMKSCLTLETLLRVVSQAAIKVEGKSIHLGHFNDEHEAARK